MKNPLKSLTKLTTLTFPSYKRPFYANHIIHKAKKTVYHCSTKNGLTHIHFT